MRKIKSKKELIKLLSAKKDLMNQQFGINKISIFGSFSREDFTYTSDIDILIEVTESKKTLINRLRIKQYFEHEFGRPVDISYFDTLHPIIKDSCLKDIVNV